MITSVRDLQIGEMINISAAWVGPQKTVFLAIAQIAPHFDRVETVHGALIAGRDGASADAALADLTAQAEALDNRHDHMVRGLYYLLIAAKDFELGREFSDSARIDTITRAIKALFPEQLRAVQASYQAEAGNAAQLEALATSEFAGLLSDIHITKETTALDMVHEISNVGRALGALENQRSLTAAQLKKETMTRAEVRRRMRDWAQVVEAILVNLQIASASPDAIDTLRQPLLDTVDKAAARRREKRARREDSDEAPRNTNGQ